MTPQELFENLCIMYPKVWDVSARGEWAKVYARGLNGVSGPILKEAFEKALASQKFKPTQFRHPPNVEDIRAHLPTPPPKVSENKYEVPFPHKGKADQMFRTDSECKQAVSEGWGLGLFEFIAKHGYTPSMNQRQHIIDTNQLFHDQYKACLDGSKIPADRFDEETQARCREMGLDGVPIPRNMLNMFEGQIAKRNNIVETYG